MKREERNAGVVGSSDSLTVVSLLLPGQSSIHTLACSSLDLEGKLVVKFL
jgi:hypothetical protein